jgi:hypothetical protein
LDNKIVINFRKLALIFVKLIAKIIKNSLIQSVTLQEVLTQTLIDMISPKLLKTKTFFLLICFCFFMINISFLWGSQTKEKILEQLETLHTTFEKKLKQDPNNAGAKKLNENIESILAAVEPNGEITKDKAKLKKLINDGLKIAGKYKTKDAKSLVIALESLNALLEANKNTSSRTPINSSKSTSTGDNSQANENVEVIAEESNSESEEPIDEEATQEARIESLPSENRPADQPAPTSNDWKSSGNLTYFWLSILSSLLIMGIFWVYKHFSKRNSQIVERIEELEQKMDTRGLNDSSMQTGWEVTLQQQKYKMETLENNVSAYMKKLGERLEKIEETQQTIISVRKADEVESAVPNYNYQERLSVKFTQPANYSSEFSYHNLIETSYKIHNLLQGLQERTQISSLFNAIESVLPTLRNITHLSPELRLQLAKIVQLAYTSAVNEGNSDWYEPLKEAMEELHFEISDKMVGRMAFTEHYADNLAYDTFLTDFSIRTEEYPNFENAVYHIERSEAFQEEINNIILFTLRPVVCFYDDNGKTVLKKGKYVINV